MTLYSFRKIYARLVLSRAKHRSLHGHPKLALKIARWVCSYTYPGSAFFSCDSAPLDIVTKRREGFERLARLFRQRSPKTIALSAGLETSMPDLAFVNAHRVPFQIQQYVQEHPGVGSIVEEADRAAVAAIDGNRCH